MKDGNELKTTFQRNQWLKRRILKFWPDSFFRKMSYLCNRMSANSITLVWANNWVFTLKPTTLSSGKRAGCPRTERLAAQILLHPSLLLGYFLQHLQIKVILIEGEYVSTHTCVNKLTPFGILIEVKVTCEMNTVVKKTQLRLYFLGILIKNISKRQLLSFATPP